MNPPESASVAPQRLLFAATIFVSAFLLFMVQPLIAKQILPWFGGSAAVWTVCLVFFQVALLAGYAYADQVTRRLGPAAQARLHMALLVVSLATLPIVVGAHWKPAGAEEPTARILGLLVATIGLPYFLLSTTGPLLQSWLARAPWGAAVYRYFALSNLASLASLLAYPVLIEPHWPLAQQARAWSLGYAAFVLLCVATAAVAARQARGAGVQKRAVAADEPAPDARRQALWLALPALASALLMAVSNHITQNVAAVPFLWVLPLALYLLSFVLTFDSERWYRRGFWLPLAAVLLLLCAYGLNAGLGSDVKTAIPLYLAGLFVACVCLHGEAARRKPGARYLTRFYLMLSIGGALGGIAVGLVAPQVLPAYYELGIALTLTALLGAFVLGGRRQAIVALVVAFGCAWGLAQQVRDDLGGARLAQRNFYGTLVTLDARRDDPADDVRQMYHGAVKHGEQFLAPARRREPTTYYGPTSGVGLAIAAAPAGARRIGLIGLGTGTLAAYGRAGDSMRVYEINPQVFDVADSEFSFLRDSPARIERVLGDARLALEREPSQRFDVLAVDAFSGDSVPVHLITAQALEVYRRHLAPGGVVAFHVTNRFLALAPVVAANAAARGLHALLVHDEAEGSAALRRTDWVLVAADASALQAEALRRAASPVAAIPGLRAWTDDDHNLFSVLK